MPFIVVFNIIIAVLMAIVLVVILGASVIGGDGKKVTNSERVLKQQKTIMKVKSISYIVFFAILLVMIIINLIF